MLMFRCRGSKEVEITVSYYVPGPAGSLFNPLTDAVSFKDHCPPPDLWETKAQRSQVTCSRPHSSWVAGLGLYLDLWTWLLNILPMLSLRGTSFSSFSNSHWNMLKVALLIPEVLFLVELQFSYLYDKSQSPRCTSRQASQVPWCPTAMANLGC